jgi:hypothetical protein
MKVRDEVQVREAVEVPQARRELRVDLDPALNLAGGHRLQRHAFETGKRRPQDAHGVIANRGGRFDSIHTGVMLARFCIATRRVAVLVVLA